MPVYNINGLTVQAAAPLSDDEIDQIATQHAPSASSSPDPGAKASFAGEAAKGLDSNLNAVAHAVLMRPGEMLTSALAKAFPNNFDDTSAQDEAAYRAAQSKDAPAINSVTDIQSPRDAALWAVNRAGAAALQIATAAAGGVPAAAVLGGAEGADEAYGNTNGNIPATIAGGALGAGAAALPAHYLFGAGNGVVSGTLKAALANTAIGAVSPLAQTIPQAIASGNPADAVPSASQVADSAAAGGLVGGLVGGIAHGAPAPEAPDTLAPARAALAQRIQAEAKSQGYSLKDTNPSGDTARILNNVHNSLAEEIKANAKVLRDQLDPALASSPQDFAQRVQAQATLRDARNKVKSTASPDDIANLANLVGDSAEGQQLIHSVNQSNVLTDLTNNGLIGGISKYVEKVNPFYGLNHTGFGANFPGLVRASELGELGAGAYFAPHAIPYALGTYGAARGIDAMTGRRYPINKFVSDNIGAAEQPDFSQYPSVFDQKQALAQSSSNDEARLANREQQLRNQRRLDNVAGLNGFDRSIYDQTGLLPHQTMQGVISLARQGRITPQEAQAFFAKPRDLMQGNAGNHIIDMLDDMARKGQLVRDAAWQPAQTSSSANPPNPAYEAQARGNQDRVTAAVSRVDASVLDPRWKQAISQAITKIGKTNNRADAREVAKALQASLPDDETRAFAAQQIEPLITQIRHFTRESAEKAQPLQPEVVSRDSRGRPLQRKPLGYTEKLLDAFTAAVPRGDAPVGANATSRLRANLYKKAAGISKPAFEGPVEPSEGYLKRVADFHDKAVHDPSNPAVKRSYDALTRETIAQYKSLGNLKVEPWRGQGEPYRNSREMMQDVQRNGHLWFLPTDTAFGDGGSVAHPMLAETQFKTTDGQPLLVNDLFRIVHDFYGHTQGGYQFGPKGEYNAFREHAQMYSKQALPALAAETLAQNAWVNYGPHMRRANGSIPQKGDADFVPAPQRRFSDQKAYAFPHELIESDPALSRPGDAISALARTQLERTVNEIDGSPGTFFQRIAQGSDIAAKSKSLYDRVAGFKALAPYLTPDERNGLAIQTARNIVDVFKTLPSAEEMASVAYSGRAKRGWYEKSANAIQNIFGAEDAPRFAALLASLSPQISVEMNLTNALNMWASWVDAGRPTDPGEITRLFSESVGRPSGGDVTKMTSWLNNTLRTLTSEDPRVDISGPKVSSFMKNLMGEVHEVTNDTWMGNYSGVNADEVFKASRPKSMNDQFGTFGTKNGGYLAQSVLTRKAAEILTQRTGQKWTPAEVQETVWSWAKALAEKSSVDPEDRSPSDIVSQGDLSHGEINSVPDFSKLFAREMYGRILSDAGYGDQIAALTQGIPGGAQGGDGVDERTSPFSAEGAGIDPASFRGHLSSAADRLTKLISGQSRYKSSTRGALTARRNIVEGADLRPGEELVSQHPIMLEAMQEAHRLGGIKSGYRVEMLPGKEAAVVKMPPKAASFERPSAPVPPFHAAMDPEGRQVISRFIAGMEKPDGTLKSISEPEMRTIAKTISRLIEDVHPSEMQGNNGLYNSDNNTIQIGKGLTPEEHERVLGHETGHAVEALSRVGQALKNDRVTGPLIVHELQDVSRLERPHLWKDDAELEKNFDVNPSSVREYRNRLDELLADGIRHYMAKPASMKKTAPNAAKFLRDIVNPTKIGKVIAFTSLAGLTLPAILQGAMAYFYRGDDKKDQ